MGGQTIHNSVYNSRFTVHYSLIQITGHGRGNKTPYSVILPVLHVQYSLMAIIWDAGENDQITLKLPSIFLTNLYTILKILCITICIKRKLHLTYWKHEDLAHPCLKLFASNFSTQHWHSNLTQEVFDAFSGVLHTVNACFTVDMFPVFRLCPNIVSICTTFQGLALIYIQWF